MSAHGFVTVVNEQRDFEMLRYDVFVAALFKVLSPEMMKAHAAMLVAGEAGELVDAIKKEIIYNKPLDRDNLVEELGDLRFGIQAVMNLYGISEQEVLQTNADKLAVRYKGLTYSDKAAQDRADKQGE
jgi:NTP pyrophosphatase (non-canonical NTP hydrolase)